MNSENVLFERIVNLLRLAHDEVDVERDVYLSSIWVQEIELIIGTEILAPGLDGLDVTSWLGMTAVEGISEADGIGVLRQSIQEPYSLFALAGDHRDYWLGTRIPIEISDQDLAHFICAFLEEVYRSRAHALFSKAC